MKTRLVLFLLATFALLSSACVGYVDGNNRPFAVGMQPIEVGTFGPGHPYRPITGLPGQHMLMQGSLRTNSLCDPRGFRAQGGFQTRQIPQQWGQVNPYCYRPQQGCQQNVGYGGGYGGYPQYQQLPPMFGQPPIYRYYQNPNNNTATAITGGGRLQPGRYNPRTGRWE